MPCTLWCHWQRNLYHVNSDGSFWFVSKCPRIKIVIEMFSQQKHLNLRGLDQPPQIQMRHWDGAATDGIHQANSCTANTRKGTVRVQNVALRTECKCQLQNVLAVTWTSGLTPLTLSFHWQKSKMHSGFGEDTIIRIKSLKCSKIISLVLCPPPPCTSTSYTHSMLPRFECCLSMSPLLCFVLFFSF